MAERVKKSHWASGRPAENEPQGPTGFEEELVRLGLDEHSCVASNELRRWCERNKDRYYIPEWLLKEWGISVNANLNR